MVMQGGSKVMYGCHMIVSEEPFF